MTEWVFPWERDKFTRKQHAILKQMASSDLETASWLTKPRTEDIPQKTTKILDALGAKNPKTNIPYRSVFLMSDSRIYLDRIVSLVPIVYVLSTGEAFNSVAGTQAATIFEDDARYEDFLLTGLFIWDGIDAVQPTKFSKLSTFGSDMYVLLKERSKIPQAYNLFLYGGEVDIDIVHKNLTSVFSFSFAGMLIQDSMVFRMKAPLDSILLEDI